MAPLAKDEPFLHRATRRTAEKHVRHIEAWMEANLAEPIGLQDMAAVVNLAPRSVQYAFRRSRGCTPIQALLQCRLERARRELLEADPWVTVTEVATLCGFDHLSRFARRYRERFGEPPSATLARARKSWLSVSSGA
jgi:transcriptional regulator GlxA family with amidase domain